MDELLRDHVNRLDSENRLLIGRQKTELKALSERLDTYPAREDVLALRGELKAGLDAAAVRACSHRFCFFLIFFRV